MHRILPIVAVVIAIFCVYNLTKKSGGKNCNGPTIFEDFLSNTECDDLIRAATALGLKRSTVVKTGVDESRTSSQVFLPPGNVSGTMLKSKVSRFFGVPITKMEDVQILRYEPGQQYKPHFDGCDDGCDSGKNLDRTQTIFVYLSDVESGGETAFPNAGKRVKPKKGRALHWFNIEPNTLQNLECSLHGGTPVKRGQKWAANIWIRL